MNNLLYHSAFPGKTSDLGQRRVTPSDRKCSFFAGMEFRAILLRGMAVGESMGEDVVRTTFLLQGRGGGRLLASF